MIPPQQNQRQPPLPVGPGGPGGPAGPGGPPPYSAASAAAARLKRPLPMPEAASSNAPDDKSRIIKEELPAPSAPKRMNMGPAAAGGPKPGQTVNKTEAAEEVAVKSEGPSAPSAQISVR